MRNDVPPSRIDGWLAVVMTLLFTPLHGAVTWPSVENFTWNFDLGVGGPSSSTGDMLVIQLDSTDRLVEPEVMLIRLYLGDSVEPLYSRDWAGLSSGLNGLIYQPDAWTVPAGVSKGRLELGMQTGAVHLRSMTVRIATGTREYSTTVTPYVRLVPEPTTALILMTTGLFALQRKRSAPHVRINHQSASF